MSEWVDAALQLWRWGLNVLPAGRGEKYPNLEWRRYEHERVTEQWVRTRFLVKCNYWIVCGKISGVVVLDLDTADTIRWWRDKIGDQLDRAPKVKTALGYHAYFAWTEQATNWAFHGYARDADGNPVRLDFEVRSTGGGVVAPPSVRAADDKHSCDDCPHDYVWKRLPDLDETGVVRWPQLPVELLSREAAGLAGPTSDSGAVAGRSRLSDLLQHPPEKGGRNIWLTEVAGHYAKQFRDRRDAYDTHFDIAVRLMPDPHGADEIEKTRESIWTKEHRKQQQADPTVQLGAGDQHELTDMGNARRLIDNHSKQIRYVGNWKVWLTWTGTRWIRDELGQVDLMAKSTARSILPEAAAVNDDSQRAATTKHAVKSQSASSIRDMVTLAKSEPEVAIRATDLDANPRLLNLLNGTYDWRANKFRDHDPADLNTKLAGPEYDQTATCPHWDAALQTWLPDPQLRQWIRRAVGYCLTGDLSEKCLFVVYGPTDAGKSVFIETILALTGDYGHVVKDDTLLLTRGKGGNTDDLADLKGIRFASLSETPEGARLDTALIKRLTGGSPVTTMRKYEHPVTWSPTAKFWIDTNHRPKINPDDDATWNRVRLVPFENRLPAERQDKELRNKLLTELPGILNWALTGLVDWQQHGLGVDTTIKSATDQYRHDEDSLEQFLNEWYQPDPKGVVRATALYEAYKEYTGDHWTTSGQLAQRMADRGYTKGKVHGGVMGYRGLTVTVESGRLPEAVQGVAVSRSPEVSPRLPAYTPRSGESS
jgi:P4 family phage/plasmid primase-like protien